MTLDLNDAAIIADAADDIPTVNAQEVRRHLEIITSHAARVINAKDRPGVLQLFRVHPLNEKLAVPSRFQIDDLERMVGTALNDGAAGHNVYVEARTVRLGLVGLQRGTAEDTAWVFGLVVDSDADKEGKAGNIPNDAQASFEVETSPGNRHLWYLFDRAITANEAKPIGEAMRASSRADHDTGVITQPYRVAGTPNYPSKSKQERGRLTVEATRIIAHSGRLWDPAELLKAFSPATMKPAEPVQIAIAANNGDEATLPEDLLALIRDGLPAGKFDRSARFHGVIAELHKRHWSAEAIKALLAKYPNGIALKYKGRIVADEIDRSLKKIIPNEQINIEFAASLGSGSGNNGGGGGITGAASLGSGPGSTAGPTPRTIPTIRVVSGQLPQAVAAAERALIASGLPVFARAGALVYPFIEELPAAGEHRTSVASLCAFCPDSLVEWLADSALFQRMKRNQWVDINLPLQIVRILLARKARSIFPHIKGVITTPTLRPDGSLLDTPGYDPQSELYLALSGFTLPDIPKQPSREQAEAALELLLDLLSEFAFAEPLDQVIAVSGILTALVRGSLPTAPMYLIRAHAPGTGKSYLVDVIAAIASGRWCPVITASKNAEETEKRLGAIILGGSSIVSLDNCDRDLEGQLLCQVCERPVVKVRVLGRSEMPECQCRIALFATGNNIIFAGDMIRRGLTCNLDAPVERPELREFERAPLDEVFANRARYVAAGLTIIRAYLTCGAPAVCESPLGSYPDWSRMVRSPLVWLGLPDPVDSMETAREEDTRLSEIRELFNLWKKDLTLDKDYTVAEIIAIACPPPDPNDYNPRPPQLLRDFLMQVAADKMDKGKVSPKRLGWWPRGVSGRVVDGFRLNPGHAERCARRTIS